MNGIFYRNVGKYLAVFTIGYVPISMPMYEHGSHLFSPVTSAQTAVIGLHIPDLTIVVTAIREAFVVIITEVHKRCTAVQCSNKQTS
jgi:hypothetical protein